MVWQLGDDKNPVDELEAGSHSFNPALQDKKTVVTPAHTIFHSISAK
jgi:hypothetical protein